jgi:hypothetical protein
LVGAPRFELGTSCAQGRRATRLRYAPTVLISYSNVWANFASTPAPSHCFLRPVHNVCRSLIHFATVFSVYFLSRARCLSFHPYGLSRFTAALPLLITITTSATFRMSSKGLQSTTTKSALYPERIEPLRFPIPRHSAETDVAALIASIGGIPTFASSTVSSDTPRPWCGDLDLYSTGLVSARLRSGILPGRAQNGDCS